MEGKMPNAGNKLVIEMAPWTNGDAIRDMTDEELASFITSDLCELLCGSPLFCDGDCDKKMLDWLRLEVNDGKEEKEENQPAK